MKRKVYLICLALIIIGVVKYAYSEDVWNAKMRKVATALQVLVPFISDNSPATPLEGPEQMAEIDQLVSAVADLKNHIRSHGGADSINAADPLFPMVISDFAFDVDRAAKLYKSGGQVQYARSILRSSIAYCAACHTGVPNKSDFEFPLFTRAAEGLSLSEKMNLLIANRRFDDAIDLFNVHLLSKNLKGVDSFEFEKAVRLAISILVRVNPDPDSALVLVKNVRKSKLSSPSFSNELKGWTAGLERWKKNRYPQLVIDEDYFSLTKDLFAQAKKLKKTPFDRSADVDYLRVTALLHKALMLNPKTEQASEIYLMLGEAYEVLQELGLWSLHENYYEACIRRSPNSSIAADCYKNYEDSVTTGYTGSSTVRLPNEVQEKLGKLKSLSTLKVEVKDEKN